MLLGLGIGLGMLAFCTGVVFVNAAVDTLRERLGI